jgi:hypothetical protein
LLQLRDVKGMLGTVHELAAGKGESEKLDACLICCQLTFTHFEGFGLKDIFLYNLNF